MDATLSAATATLELNTIQWLGRSRIDMVFAAIGAACCDFTESPLTPPLEVPQFVPLTLP